MEVHPDFDAGEVARTVALAVSNLHTRSQSSDSGTDETPLVRNKRRPEMNINSEVDDDDRNNLVSNGKSKWFYYCHSIPKRHVLTLLGFLGFCNVYALRVNLSVALVAMINHTAIYKNESMEYECQIADPDPDDLPKDGDFAWDSEIQAHILGSFFYGYLVTQIPGGRIAEMFGGKWLFGGGVLCTAVLTLLTPKAAEWGYGALIGLRVLEGLGEGVTFPAMHAMLGRWMPKLERSLLSTIIYSGAQIGTVISMPISGMLCDSDFLGGWPSVFYVFGFLGCLWFIFWAFFIYETPDVHPTISRAELMLIQSGRNQDCKNEKKKNPTPWRAILTSIPVYTLMITHFGQNWGFYTFLTELPNYLSSVLLFTLKKNGFLSALPYLLQAIVSWTTSYIADLLRQRQYFSISTIRKMFNTIGFFGPALCLFGVILAACNHIWSVFFLTLAMGFNGCTYSGYMVTHVDMSPDFAGTLMGMTNAFATLAGIFAPLAVGALTKDDHTLARWRTVFIISACVYVLTGTLFVIFGSAKLQKWGISKEESAKEDKEDTHKDKDSDLPEE